VSTSRTSPQRGHRIRVATVVVDADDLPASVAFWSSVLVAPVAAGDPSVDRYVSLGPAAGGLRLLLQRVPERSSAKNRVHLDIETDRPGEEVERIIGLGGRIVRPLGHGAAVLRDPAGNEFCVIFPETSEWPAGTTLVHRRPGGG
jgi:predicted enzyme related to lactoylglutathione lyase